MRTRILAPVGPYEKRRQQPSLPLPPRPIVGSRGSGKTRGRRHSQTWMPDMATLCGRVLRGLHRPGSDLRRLRNRLCLLRIRAGILRAEGIHLCAQALFVLSGAATRHRRWRWLELRRQQQRRRRIRRGRLQPRPARDVRRDVRSLQQGDAGPLPSNRRAPGLLQRLLPVDARIVPHRFSIERRRPRGCRLSRFLLGWRVRMMVAT